jgi:hypothetical protein
MSVSSLANTNFASWLQGPPAPEAVEPRRIGPDHDGDADDRAGSVVPVVNTRGQPTGLLVNDKA